MSLEIAQRKILICQNTACRKAGAIKVIAAFEARPLAETEIQPVRCLGQCGNGPMVLVLPDEIWYDRVLPEEVDAIVSQHLQDGKPVKTMLYRRFHLHSSK